MSDETMVIVSNATVLSMLLLAALVPEGTALALLLFTLPAAALVALRIGKDPMDHDWTPCDPEPATRIDRCQRCGCTRYAIEACVAPPDEAARLGQPLTRIAVLTQYTLPGSPTRLDVEPPCVGGAPVRIAPPRRTAPAARALAVA